MRYDHNTVLQNKYKYVVPWGQNMNEILIYGFKWTVYTFPHVPFFKLCSSPYYAANIYTVFYV